MTAGLVRIRSGRAAAPEGLLSCCMILHRRGCLRMLCHVVLFRRICHSPRREAYIASGTGISRLWQGCPIPTSAVACKAHERRRNPPQVSGRPLLGLRIARAVIAPDAAMHRVKGCVDRSDGFPHRRAGGLSSRRRAFLRLAVWPRGVCADTGVYAVVKEQRRARIISLSYTSRKIGQKFGVLAKLFEKIPEIFPSA